MPTEATNDPIGFAVGDRVRVVRAQGVRFEQGDVGTVVDLDHGLYCTNLMRGGACAGAIRLDNGSFIGHGWLASRFERVEPNARDLQVGDWVSWGSQAYWYRVCGIRSAVIEYDLTAGSGGLRAGRGEACLPRNPVFGSPGGAELPDWVNALIPTPGSLPEQILPLEETDLLLLWNALACPPEPLFLERLSTLVTDPASVEGMVWFCSGCGAPSADEDSYRDGYGNVLCEPCYDSYTVCYDCEERFPRTEMTVVAEDLIHQRCLESNYVWCDYCDHYIHVDYRSEHRHGECDCEAPAQEFRIRNDGNGMLANDTRVRIELPKGMISEAGTEAIRTLLYRTGRDIYYRESNAEVFQNWLELAAAATTMDQRWQTKEGNFTKRLSRLAYKEHGLKLPPDIVSEVGNIARAHSGGSTYHLEVTRDLNMSPEEFFHEGSCWWTDHSESRCALKTNGGFGLRSFDERDPIYAEVSGRAWVMPMKLVDDTPTPTFDTETPAAFLVFNGYGDLEGYVAPRLVAHMAGMTYRKVSPMRISPMYINNSVGYLVAPEEIASKYETMSLSFTLSEHAGLYAEEIRGAAQRVPAKAVPTTIEELVPF